VNNALDFLSEGGSITVSFSVKDREVVTEVADTGPGISPEVFNRLFQPFTTHGKIHGTGLGLSICQRILADHGGWIRGTNRPEGGAVFSFGLPIAVNTQPI
jgi:signal transduction histidine kinase